MGTTKAATYKNPSCESHVGNLNADVMSCVLNGAEAADDVILLRKMGENNTYARITAIADAGIVTGTADLGTVSREDGQADEPDLFGADIDFATANQAVIADMVPVGYKHDVALTIKTNAVGNDGKELKFLVEFINTAG